MTKPKLCLFCGKPPGRRIGSGGEADAIPSTAEDVAYLICKNCGACGPLVATTVRARESTKIELCVKAWNKRVENGR